MNSHADDMGAREPGMGREQDAGVAARRVDSETGASGQSGTGAGVDPGMRDAERSIDAVGEGAYSTERSGDELGFGSAATTATTDHGVIREWAEDRHALPATVAGTEHGGGIGELRLDFQFGQDLEELREISWDEWLAAFDERGLQFVYQEHPRADGSVSNEFHLESRGGRL